jgi:hypothetical protein
LSQESSVCLSCLTVLLIRQLHVTDCNSHTQDHYVELVSEFEYYRVCPVATEPKSVPRVVLIM